MQEEKHHSTSDSSLPSNSGSNSTRAHAHISQKTFQQRKKKLFEQMRDNSIVILPSANECIRNNDVHYKFRQHSDFYYLTGFNEPEAVAIFIRRNASNEFFLFNRNRDPKAEIWTGKRAGQAGACQDFGADQAFPIGDIDTVMPDFLQNITCIYYPVGFDKHFESQLMAWIKTLRDKARTGVHAPDEFIHTEQLLHEMRLIKDDDEIACLRNAAEISAQAHVKAMQACRPSLFEYQLEAELRHAFLHGGCLDIAYDSIVAGGKNACVLHYIENTAQLNDGDLVLIDAGGEYDYYAADITRTFPVNGKFSTEQTAIYNIVLKAQLAGIEQVRIGKPWNAIQDAILPIITQGLIDCGILSGDCDALIAEKAYMDFYMHNAGHWLGLDVHDVGHYKIDNAWRPLQAGMVMTVEPGIYISPNNENVDAKWHGIGVRIEDDVLVTEAGPDVLSRAAPKTIAEIEALMQTR